jgi:hypothetical protein
MCGGGGAQFLPNPSHMIWKLTVNATLATGHQASPTHYYKFHILQRIYSTQYFRILFWKWGRWQKVLKAVPASGLHYKFIFGNLRLPNCQFLNLKKLTLLGGGCLKWHSTYVCTHSWVGQTNLSFVDHMCTYLYIYVGVQELQSRARKKNWLIV